MQILVGSGTLANDVVAAQLSLDPGPGLVVTNGEFGERLADHARRMHLPHEALVFEWGEPFDARAARVGDRAVGRAMALGGRQRDVHGHAQRRRAPHAAEARATASRCVWTA